MEEGSAEDGSKPKESAFVNKLNDFIVQKHRLILIAILAFAFIIRLKYMTVNAAVWWDEADYLTLAKHYGLGLPEQAAPWRARAIPMLWGIFYWLGANEWFIRFFNQFVAVGSVLVTYLIGKEFFSKKIGLLAALFMAVYFEHLFWSARLSADIYSLVLFGLAALFFYRGYVKNEGKNYLYATGAIYGAGIYAYDGIGFLAIFLFLFLLVTERLKFLKNKKIWIIVGCALLAALPFAIYHQAEFGSPYPRINMILSSPDEGLAASQQGAVGKIISSLPNMFSYITSTGYYLGSGLPAIGLGSIAKWALIIAFIAGLAAFINMFIGFDKVWKKENKRLIGDFYLLLWGFSVLLIFGIVNAFSAFIFEPRFVFPAMPILFIICALGIRKIFWFISKYNKEMAVAVVALLMIFGIYAQLSYADNLINYKKDSFSQEREGGLWLKEHTNPGDVIVGCGLSVPIVYYSERDFKSASSGNITLAEENIRTYKPRFYVLDGLDYAGCANEQYPMINQEKMTPVMAFFMDEAKTQPIYIIFEINQSAYQ
ncbi:MAG: glycosyltransferase family 39 protein [Candidatus Nanoarchaeia archaeon]|nr:glycosyltransferase family 39 protein [Candidatus Nanoarchaeia archaeon]